MQKECVQCKNQFESPAAASKFCSETCRQSYYSNRECINKNCNNIVPWSAFINGKWSNLKNRKRCLDCQPLGAKIEKTEEEKQLLRQKNIEKVKRHYYKNYYKNKAVIAVKRSAQKKKESFINLTNGCQFCGYNKCMQALCFHHVNESEKEFSISAREMQYSLNRIVNEIKKCVIACCNCHTEIHQNLIFKDLIAVKHKELIEKIDKALASKSIEEALLCHKRKILAKAKKICTCGQPKMVKAKVCKVCYLKSLENKFKKTTTV